MAGEQLILPGQLTGAAELFVPTQTSGLEDASWLPPREFWRLPDGPIETPVDERGIVDIEQLVEQVKSTVDPEYIWQQADSTHHFYWPASRYSYDDKWNSDKRTYSTGRFRDLPIHKGDLPREFENWLHLITLPPDMPDREVIQYRMEAWRVAVNLFSSARRVVLWEKRAEKRSKYIERHPEVITFQEEDEFAREYIAEILDKHFRGVERHMSELRRVPPEFRLIEPCDSPKELATNLGKFVAQRSLKLRHVVNDSRTLATAA